MSPLWGTVIGQDEVVARLDASARAPVHAYLFVGPPGSGKRAAARAFSAALLCPHGGDGTCRDCRLALAGTHPDVTEVERVGAAISVEQAEEIVRLSSLAPVEGNRKVLVLDEFHLLRPEAAARLLKAVEEPPPSTVFVVLADTITPDLVTIASRCVRIEFRTIPDAVVAAALQADGVEPAAAAAAAAAAGGDLDRARLLAADPSLVARREAFTRLPQRLDGTGHAVAAAVDELLGLIEGAAKPLQQRQAIELAELQERVERLGERGSGRRALEERHRRELRRHRTDELQSGLVALAGAYRDRLAAGTVHEPGAAIEAVTAVHEAIEAMERNPNEVLLLQALLLRLPSL